MALALADRVQETTTTAGTGTVSLAGATSGYRTFVAGVGSGNTTYYTILDGGLAWEVGIGTVTAGSPDTLSRDTVLSNSLGTTARISLSGGICTVWVDYPAEKAVTTDTLATPPAIGGTTPAAGTFTTLTGNLTCAFGAGSANYSTADGAAAGYSPVFQALGSDTNISMVFKPKGTGAIDLAAGSKGVVISNGGTVTAITRTAAGSGYATAPTVTIAPPTTPGGVQATATCTITAGAVDSVFTITNPGSGYVRSEEHTSELQSH